MNQPQRMSPLTAFFLGLFGTGTVVVICVATIALFGLKTLGGQITGLQGIVVKVAENLPELVDSLPPIVRDSLRDRRAPEYASQVAAEVTFSPGESADLVHPVVMIRNIGEEMITLLSIRVEAVDGEHRAVRDWTQMAVTPIGLDNDWPGPMLPGATRRILLPTRSLHSKPGRSLSGVVEVTDIRVWDRVVHAADRVAAGPG